MNIKLSNRGQIVLPAEFRHQDDIHAGQQFQVERIEAGCYLLKQQPEASSPGLVDWLLSCPEKDWFQPLPSDSTATLL